MRDLLPLILATVLVSACSEYGGLPTSPDDGPAGVPRLLAGDAVVALQERPQTDPVSCSSLTAPHALRVARAAYLCIPLAAPSAPITAITVTSTQMRWDDTAGRWLPKESYTTTSISGLTENPIEERVTILPRLTAAPGQTAAQTTFSVLISNDAGLSATYTAVAILVPSPGVAIFEPKSGDRVSPGKTMDVRVRAKSVNGIVAIRVMTAGVYTKTVTYTAPTQSDSLEVLVQVPLPDTTSPGEMTLRVQAEDALGLDAETGPVTLTVSGQDGSGASYPLVRLGGLFVARVENGDELKLRATDSNRVTSIGYLLYTRDGAFARTDSMVVNAKDTTVTFAWAYGDSLAGAYQLIAWARNSLGARSYYATASESTTDLAAATAQLITLVTGRTVPGTATYAYGAADELRGRVYYTNAQQNTVDVVDLETLALLKRIPVGSSPAGLTMLRKMDGTPANRLVVANSGGNDLSIVDLESLTELARPVIPAMQLEWKGICLQGSDTTCVTRLGDQPQRLAAECHDASCSSHRLYVTTRTAPGSEYTAVRVLYLSQASTITTSDVITPSGGDLQAMADMHIVDALSIYAVNRQSGARSLLRTAQNASVSATFHRGDGPRLATYEVAQGRLLIAQTPGSRTRSSSSPLLMSVAITPMFTARAVLVEDLTAKAMDGAKALQANRDGTRSLLAGTGAVILLDGDLSPKGAFNLTGSGAATPQHVGLAQNHVATSLNANQGGLVALGGFANATLDLYGTQHFGRVATLDLSTSVTGPIFILRQSASSWKVVAVTARGVHVTPYGLPN